MKKVILIGTGIMSTTLAMMLKKIDKNIQINIYEKLKEPALESSEAMNNAGTGHSGYCELNYTPIVNDEVEISKAVKIARDFLYSLDFWSFLVKEGNIKDPKSFIRSIPHYSFVDNEKDITFLEKRYNKMKENVFFKDMVYSTDYNQIKEWIPLVIKNRKDLKNIACTKHEKGTDVDFGNLTKNMLNSLIENNMVNCFFEHEILEIYKKDQKWILKIKDIKKDLQIEDESDYVFIGAGGNSILLLEKSNIEESKKYGGFPVGGEWLVCENPEVVKQHHSKVYGNAKIGAPPMSVPHLDSRVINGTNKLLFGPFATFSTKFLKNGSNLDFFKSLKLYNISFVSQAGLKNIDLTKYLINQVSLSKKEKMDELKRYFPMANENDWKEYKAGQRVQIIKKDKIKGGVLEFGTEVVISKDKTLSAMLGASPGASTSVAIIIDVIEKMFENSEYNQKIMNIIKSYKEVDSIKIEQKYKEVFDILKLNNN